MGAIDIVTKQDLEQFKAELLVSLQKMIVPAANTESRRWLKTYEVRQMLGNISAGTLQTMRNNGTLKYSLVNGLALYEYEEVVKLMEELQINVRRKGAR